MELTVLKLALWLACAKLQILTDRDSREWMLEYILTARKLEAALAVAKQVREGTAS